MHAPFAFFLSIYFRMLGDGYFLFDCFTVVFTFWNVWLYFLELAIIQCFILLPISGTLCYTVLSFFGKESLALWVGHLWIGFKFRGIEGYTGWITLGCCIPEVYLSGIFCCRCYV